ncbi:MAG: lysylphosphatidylglycerol synthase transmembrane domain-containing protein [Breznakibacter sp.]
MKSTTKQIVQFLIFLAIGASVFFLLYKDQDWGQMGKILSQADFKWIWLSLFFGVISHWARGQRWKMLIETAGGHVKWHHTLMAVFIGYLANMVLPRMGEVTRCGVLSKYKHLPFAMLAGTVVAERLVDLGCLLLVVLSAFVIEFDVLHGFMAKNVNFIWILDLFTSVWWWIFVSGLVVLVWYLLRRAVQMSVFRRFKGIWANFKEGFRSVKTMQSKTKFLLYSVTIWAMYFLMQYTCFFAMDETAPLGPTVALVLLATGSIGMLAPVQGGVGTWHGMVIATLALYGVTSDPAYAFALLVHGAQNLMIVVVGLASLLLFPLLNPVQKNQVET